MQPLGKTTHILEIAPKAHVLAIDIDEQRLARVKEKSKPLKATCHSQKW